MKGPTAVKSHRPAIFWLICFAGAYAGSASATSSKSLPAFEDLIRKSAVSQDSLDAYLAGPNWAQFDPELGYVRRNHITKGGSADPAPVWSWAVDRSSLISTVQSNGARTSFLYANRRPRINVYGDSFTECMQVNDGETWEEYLAAHLGEPIGNFGVGGYGVYQAYRRMLREEATDHGADHVILYIWGDDPIRSLTRNRWATLSPMLNASVNDGQTAFHGGFWPHVEMDLSTGQFIEKENVLSSVASLHHMTDPDWLVGQLKDDLAFQLLAYAYGQTRDLNREHLDKLATWLGFDFDWDRRSSSEAASTGSAMLLAKPGETTEPSLQSEAKELLNLYAQKATLFILDKAREFARKNQKRLFIILNMTSALGEMRDNDAREDQLIIDYLTRGGFDYFDMNVIHLQSWRKLNGRLKEPQSYRDYMKQYLVNGSGHYNAQGNHLFAYAIKDAIVKWSEPKPVTYRKPEPRSFDFNDYLNPIK